LNGPLPAEKTAVAMVRYTPRPRRFSREPVGSRMVIRKAKPPGSGMSGPGSFAAFTLKTAAMSPMPENFVLVSAMRITLPVPSTCVVTASSVAVISGTMTATSTIGPTPTVPAIVRVFDVR